MSEHTANDVFVNAVRDELNGTPNASHPVQYEPLLVDGLVGCVLCGSAVDDSERWKDLHRESHDKHNRVHASIESEAHRYKSPPRYR